MSMLTIVILQANEGNNLLRKGWDREKEKKRKGQYGLRWGGEAANLAIFL